MGWKLIELIGDKRPDTPTDYCALNGKVIYKSRDEAERVLRGLNPRQRTAMKAFVCALGQHYHIGHRRGTVY